MSDPGLRRSPHNFRRASAPELPRASLRPSAFRPFVRNTLLLLCLLFLLTACGRRPGQPTPLPPGTRVVQPTPDFSAPAQADTATQTSGPGRRIPAHPPCPPAGGPHRHARANRRSQPRPGPICPVRQPQSRRIQPANRARHPFRRWPPLRRPWPRRPHQPPGWRHPHHHRPYRRPRLVRRLPCRRRRWLGACRPSARPSAMPPNSKSSRNRSALPSSPPSSPKPASPRPQSPPSPSASPPPPPPPPNPPPPLK